MRITKTNIGLIRASTTTPTVDDEKQGTNGNWAAVNGKIREGKCVKRQREKEVNSVGLRV